MKLIPLKNRKGEVIAHAQVDDEDYDELMKYKWSLGGSKNGMYARRSTTSKGGKKQKTVLLHRQIMNVEGRLVFVDHKDRDRLNCQKTNMRIATPTQNSTNRKAHGKSKFLGVTLHIKKEGTKYWRAVVYVKHKRVLSLFYPYTKCGELCAALAYDIAAEKYHGEFANLNFP